MIHIDTEFKNLIPPLTAEEYAGLETSLIQEGCRDALIVWGDILIDGHNRFEICTRHNIPFETTELFFESRNDVIEWIIKNQFGRRNLPAYERARLALRLKPVIAEKAKENQRGGQGGVLLSQKSVEAKTIDTQKELARAAGVSHDTIAKVEKIEAKAAPEVKEQLRAGEKLVMDVLQSFQVPVKFQPDALFKSKNGQWIVVECKNQERFKAPPFDGHGLPPYQVKSRMKFYEETGIRCLFFVHEPGSDCVWWQWLDVLEGLGKTQRTFTKTGKRIVYALSAFKKIDIPYDALI